MRHAIDTVSPSFPFLEDFRIGPVRCRPPGSAHLPSSTPTDFKFQCYRWLDMIRTFDLDHGTSDRYRTRSVRGL